MATLVLSSAGSAIGGALLPGGIGFLGAQISGAAIGGLIGAGIGSYVDAKLFGPTLANAQGPRLADLQILASTEGTAIPRLYGRARLAGQVIWATDFREHASTRSVGGGGGKGGGGGSSASVTEFSYTVSLAIGLCEGEITRVGRVWADGKPLSLADLTGRLHRGGEEQVADPLIEAMEGVAPAYRGLAYIVFEDLNLTPFGNRVPQLSFEVYRTLSGIEELVRAVTIIPGAGEFVYEPVAVRELLTETASRAANTHTSEGVSDWSVAIDQLQATCANVEAASLVVTWFGDDLRCGSCLIKPKVELAAKVTAPQTWRVGGLGRQQVETVSQIDGRPAYGGTPSDHSVIGAIRDLKARGLRAVFYPFVMMDIPAGNSRTDPWTGETGQPAYPWRGRIRSSFDADKTEKAATEIAAFFGSASAADFHRGGETVAYTGSAEWSYRRMVLHYAHLCAAAGGVDAFLIGSELRGLTRTRSARAIYPAVAALRVLAAEVASILPDARISYAADWSEYSGHATGDGTGDLYFNLDPLWADPNIHFVGIDNYAPLTDWRKVPRHLDREDAGSIYELEYLKSRIAGGENYDWYYESDADRAAQRRTPISDGDYGKPWVWRAKDIKSWWSNRHYDRPGGVESAVATEWQPEAKPIWFTEIGCPAIDMGTNEPNVFTDPKSSESAVPHFSRGTRDDFIQRRFIEAQMSYWGAAGTHNPVSSVYGGPMLSARDIFFWTWDARPYPAFPDRMDVWADGAAWQRGHWINGRLGAAPLDALVAAIMADVGFAEFDASMLAGVVDGFVIDRIMSPRDALAPLMLARFFDATESQGQIRFYHFGGAPVASFEPADLAVGETDANAGFQFTRGQETELPLSAKLTYIDGGLDYRQSAVEARRLAVQSQRVAATNLPMVLRQEDAQRIADVWLQQSWTMRESATLKFPPSRLALDPGDVVELAVPERVATLRLTAVTDAGVREARGVASEASLYGPAPAPQRAHMPVIAPTYGTPLVVFMDLPLLSGTETPHAPRVAVAADPWPGGVALFKGSGAGFALDRVVTREAVIGRTISALGMGVTSRWDWSAMLQVTLASGALASADITEVLGGANAAALETPEGDWEVIQFRDAVLVAPRTYELRGLLRGQAGTEAAMRAPLEPGARFCSMERSRRSG